MGSVLHHTRCYFVLSSLEILLRVAASLVTNIVGQRHVGLHCKWQTKGNRDQCVIGLNVQAEVMCQPSGFSGDVGVEEQSVLFPGQAFILTCGFWEAKQRNSLMRSGVTPGGCLAPRVPAAKEALPPA